jgi:hypothetical protein
MRNLNTLDLRHTAVTGKGIAALAALPNLRRLKLWQAEGIDDTAIPQLLKLERLEVLEIPETRISGEGLAQLQGMKQLKKLYVGGTSVTQEQVEAFRKASPHCEVAWWEKFVVPEHTELKPQQ